MKHSDFLLMYTATPVLYKMKNHDSGINQYGLRPTSHYDFIAPTNLVNFGRGTSFANLGVRRSDRGEIDSAPSNSGSAVGTQAEMLGLSGDRKLEVCTQETTALRICMAKGTESCERESAILDACLSRVGSLRSALRQAGDEFYDWYIQNVSDNHTKPFQYRPHDWRHQYAQEKLHMAAKQFGKAYGKQPKRMSWCAQWTKSEGYGKRPRLPINK